MKTAFCLLALLLAPSLAVSTPAMAQEVDCEAAQTQNDLNWCAKQEWLMADADLNEAYAAAMAFMAEIDASLPAEEQGAKAALRAAQRAWVTVRDESCAAEGYVNYGGSMQPMVIYGCSARMSAARAEELWNMTGE